MNAIINANIILEDKVLENHVVIFDEYIRNIIPICEFDKDKYDDINIIDIKGNYLSPGFIDLHIHGASGFDTMDATKEAIDTISKSICKYGTTSFLPTTMTMPKDRIINALENIKAYMKNDFVGAKVIGAHMEGPFINKKHKGAQDPTFIIKPDYEFIKPYLDIIKIITLAPEEDKNFEFIKTLKQNSNIVLSMGHTDTSFETAKEAIANGISYATHTFNAMTGLHHRKPGCVGAILSSDIYAELIADNIHVHKGLYQFFIDSKTNDKVILVTDSIRATCLKKGMYELGGQKVKVDESSARLEDDTLAGSILRLDKAIKNIYNETNLSIYQVIKMVSLNQAKAINVQDQIGSIKKGKKADLVELDKELNVLSTFIEGKKIYGGY